ncbi:MAG: AmmeMemoRadiSam system protein B [Spirochaetota bacterium]
MAEEYTLRHPVVSGLFYPDGEEQLRSGVEGYLARVDRGALAEEVGKQTGLDPSAQPPLAVIAPHAGYIYSGGVQAFSYALLDRFVFDTVVVMGPAHQTPFRGISVNLDNAYQTPLGSVEVDLDAARKLLEHDGALQRHEDAHLGEHSVEVQLPFLQVALPGVRIVPVLFGEQSRATAEKLAGALSWLMEELPRRYLCVASSDLSHYHSHVDASAMDRTLINDVKNLDLDSFAEHIQSGKTEACGFAPIMTGMMLSAQRGRGRAAVLKYSDSGEVSGNRRNVVGYLAALLY